MNRHSLSRFLSQSPQVFFSPDGAAGSAPASGGAPQPEEKPPVIPPSQTPPPSEPEKIDFKALAQAVAAEVLASQSVNGDEKKALEVLAGRNARLEADRDAKVQEIGRLKAQIPDDKQAQADASELASWRKLGESGIKKPEDVSTLVSERDTFKGREEARTKTEQRDKAAKAAGFNPEKYAALKGVDDWAYEIKTEKQDGKDVSVSYVVSKDEKGVETRKALGEVVTEVFPAMADSIKADGGGQSGSTPGARTVQQGSGGTSGAGSKFDQIRAANKKEAESGQKSQAEPLENIMRIGTNQNVAI